MVVAIQTKIGERRFAAFTRWFADCEAEKIFAFGTVARAVLGHGG
jgi:hypothetical protein